MKFKSFVWRIKAFFNNLPHDLSGSFILLSCIICSAVILIALGAGVMLPKSENAVNKSLAVLHGKNEVYINAKSENYSLSEEVAKLNEELAENEASLKDFQSSQDNLDKITQKNEELKQQEQILKDEVASKQRTLDALEKDTEAQGSATFELPGGIYTVGKQIPAGAYNVTGSGNIVIAAEKTARVSETLKSSGKDYTLNDGETVKITGSAKFTPKG